MEKRDLTLRIFFQSGWIYSRWENPTTEAASHTLNNLEGGYGTLLFSSGMAAITTALMALLKSGDHVVCVLPEKVIESPRFWLVHVHVLPTCNGHAGLELRIFQAQIPRVFTR